MSLSFWMAGAFSYSSVVKKTASMKPSVVARPVTRADAATNPQNAASATIVTSFVLSLNSQAYHDIVGQFLQAQDVA